MCVCSVEGDYDVLLLYDGPARNTSSFIGSDQHGFHGQNLADSPHSQQSTGPELLVTFLTDHDTSGLDGFDGFTFR